MSEIHIRSQLVHLFVLVLAFVVSAAHADYWDPPHASLAPNASATPVAVEKFNNRFYMVFAGFDMKLYYATTMYPGSWDSAAILLPASPLPPPVARNVALRVFNETLYVAALSQYNELLLITFDGTRWIYTGQILPTILAISPPTLEVYKEQLYVVFRGTNNQIYASNSNNGTAWSTPFIIAPPGYAVLDQIAVRALPFDNKLYFAVIGFDNHLYMWSYDGVSAVPIAAPKGTTSLFLSGTAPTLETYFGKLIVLWCDRNRQIGYSFTTAPSQNSWTTSAIPFPGQIMSTRLIAASWPLGENGMSVAIYSEEWPAQIYTSFAFLSEF